MKEKTPEESWEFWSKIVCNPDGSLNIDQVKKELHDFLFVMDSVTLVYDGVTGGRICKINTMPEEVISAAEDFYGDVYRCNCIHE